MALSKSGSCQTSLMSVFEKIIDAVVKGNVTNLIRLHFTTIFDRDTDGKLLIKIEKMGISRKMMK